MPLRKKTPAEFREYQQRALMWCVIDLHSLEAPEWFETRAGAEEYAAELEEGPVAVLEIRSHFGGAS